MCAGSLIEFAADELHQPTVFFGVPAMFIRLLDVPVERAAAIGKRLRLAVSGSAPLPAEIHDKFRERYGSVILERYGMSETIMLTSNPYRADARYANQSERRGGTVGFPLPGVSLRVRDDAGNACAVDEIGGIQVKGPNVFSGYWRMPEKTAEEFTKDGYFKTGDVGKVDARGYVTIVGRSKDLIISGGYNVYPAEIEGFINEMPGIAESAVVGVPHPDFGEVGVAVVIAKAGAQVQADEVIANLKSRLANFKIPKRCFVVPELPRNTMGKVQKKPVARPTQRVVQSLRRRAPPQTHLTCQTSAGCAARRAAKGRIAPPRLVPPGSLRRPVCRWRAPSLCPPQCLWRSVLPDPG